MLDRSRDVGAPGRRRGPPGGPGLRDGERRRRRRCAMLAALLPPPPCALCHAPADAGATGAIGPAFDDPQARRIEYRRVGGVRLVLMPSYRGNLSDARCALALRVQGERRRAIGAGYRPGPPQRRRADRTLTFFLRRSSRPTNPARSERAAARVFDRIHRVDRVEHARDVVAGVGPLVLPQGIAFATLAGLPPEYGLYTAVIPASSRRCSARAGTSFPYLTTRTRLPWSDAGACPRRLV